MYIILLLLFLTFAIIVAVNFFSYFLGNRILSNSDLWKFTELWTIFIVPFYFLNSFDIGKKNDCCSDSAVFSPDHRAGIYFMIFLCMAGYFYSSFRKKLSTPNVELIINSFLFLGFILNIFIAIQVNTSEFGAFLSLIGNVPIIMLFMIQLKKNVHLLQNELFREPVKPKNAFTDISLNILQAKIWLRFPILALIALPVLLLLTLVLFIFGQKPDSLIRAFTDTYKHGFSQLDYMCDNVQCGGHFLCSVAAKGHKTIVKPRRYGVRNGNKIICNRQLLVANAFEELIQTHLPFVHKKVRKQYNKIGNMVHRHYAIFNHKLVADTVYIIMKPLEWFFLLVLYTFHTRPEDLIAKQYISYDDRQKLK